MRFYSELTYWNTACCKKRKNAFVSLSLRWKELQNKENPCKLILYGDFLFLVHGKNKHIKAFFRCTIRCTWSYAYICDILMLSKKIKNFSKKTTTFLKKNRNFFKNVLVFLLLPMHRKPSFCGGTDLSCVLFAGKKPKTPYFISSRNDL